MLFRSAYIGNRGVTLGYRSTSSLSSNSKVETPLTKLENQDKRNAEIRDEKTIADIKELVKGFNPTDGDFTVLEERLTYFTMLKGNHPIYPIFEVASDASIFAEKEYDEQRRYFRD